MNETIPRSGQWPVDPQEGLAVDQKRIWIDGCFDFTHHGTLDEPVVINIPDLLTSEIKGHAGAMLQARKLGSELIVGIHSDEAILLNKGPTVMTLRERFVASSEYFLNSRTEHHFKNRGCGRVPVVFKIDSSCSLCNLAPVDYPLWMSFCSPWRRYHVR